MIEICAGCGRRAAEEELVCAACGRPLREGDVEQHPQGWENMPDVAEPSLRPLRQDERPPAGPPIDGEEESATDLFVAHTAAAEDETPGGRGWRVRISSNQWVAAGSAPARAVLGPSGAPDVDARRGLPQWIYPLLILAIVATSCAAAVLVILHILRSSS